MRHIHLSDEEIKLIFELESSDPSLPTLQSSRVVSSNDDELLWFYDWNQPFQEVDPNEDWDAAADFNSSDFIELTPSHGHSCFFEEYSASDAAKAHDKNSTSTHSNNINK